MWTHRCCQARAVEEHWQLEQFIDGPPQSDQALPVLVSGALAQVLLETLHPFLDGNGRLGRLLIVLSRERSRAAAAIACLPTTPTWRF